MESFDRFQPDDAQWRLLGSELRFQSPYLRVLLEKIVPPSRSTPVEWTVVRRKFAIVVAPMTEDGRLVLIRQERVPIRLALWEFPAGQVDEESSDPEVLEGTVHRELREETGYRLAEGGSITSLGYFFSSQGFTDEHAYLFLASPVIPGVAQHDHDETITGMQLVTPAELKKMIAENEIRDANTLALYARMAARNLI